MTYHMASDIARTFCQTPTRGSNRIGLRGSVSHKCFDQNVPLSIVARAVAVTKPTEAAAKSLDHAIKEEGQNSLTCHDGKVYRSAY